MTLTYTPLPATRSLPASPGLPILRPAAGPLGASMLPAGLRVDDWDLLFAAVTVRLRASLPAGAAPGTTAAALECLQALEALQDALAPERRRRAAVDAELETVTAALAAARAELARTRAGESLARHEAQHDSLTSLPNRSCFSRRLDDALGHGDRPAPNLAVLFLDLDGFKPINDRHGHATGDELLRIVAERLSRSMRAEDMVCRLGGDEFACLLANAMGREQLSRLACELFDAVSAPLKLGRQQFSVRPSIGIAVCPTDGDTTAALLKRADAAMYRAKRLQTGFAFFDRRSDV